MGAGREAFGGDVLYPAVAQVLNRAGKVVGAGFLIAEDLLISCAHVLVAAGYKAGDTAELVFPGVPGSPSMRGAVLAQGWHDPQEQDIALVRLEHAPAGTSVLRLGDAAGCDGHPVLSFGFSVRARKDGHLGLAVVAGLLRATDRADELLQLSDSNDLTTGFSGGPVLDRTTGLVVGMFTEIIPPDSYARGQNIAYATPTSVLRKAWPALEVGDVSPYRALEPFTAEHARWFRGREEAVRQVLAGMAGGQRVVLLLGPSGSGKSSLVQAGVLPALAAGGLPGSDRWRQVVVRPGPDLPQALERIGAVRGAPEGTGPAVAHGRGEERTVLVVDQFEELLAPGPTGTAGAGTDAEPSISAEAAAALTRLAGAVSSDAPLCAVLVMRDDFYSRLSALAPDLLHTALRTRGVLNVPATLTARELDAIVTGPADDLGAHFDKGLAERIVSDVLALNPGAGQAFEAPVTVLPLLEVALARLWERRLDHAGHLTHDAYKNIGGVTGATALWCDAALDELGEQHRPVARRILTDLVRPADETLHIPAARRQRTLDELRAASAADDTTAAGEAVDEVLAVLSRHRIITTRQVRESGQSEDTEGTPVAELIHDTLIHKWQTLHEWVVSDARFTNWRDHAQRDYDRWQDKAPDERDPQDLPSGSLLAEGTEWAAQRRLPPHLLAFLDAGRRRQQAAARRSRHLNTVLAAFLALALIASGIALWQRQTANAAQRAAQSRQLAAQSALFSGTAPDLASLLAVAAYRISPTAEAAAALNTAAGLPLLRRLDPASGSDFHSVNAVAFSPDGRTLAANSQDESVRQWDVATGKTSTAAHRTGYIDVVLGVGFSPDRRTLATGGVDKTVRLWDVATGEIIAALTGHTDVVLAVGFSPDGRTLATSSMDKTVRLWDVATGRTTKTITDHTGFARSIVFSPDGHSLAAGGDDGTVRLWDVATGEATAALTGHAGSVEAVAFSPDGHTLATGGDDGTVRLWDVATGKATAALTGHTGSVEAVAFSPDGHTLATGGRDGTVRLWNTAASPAVLSGNTGPVFRVLFSPDGRTLATGSGDGTVRLWNTATGEATATLTDPTKPVFRVLFSPDGRTLATGGRDGTVRLWNTATGEATATLTDHTDFVSSLGFSPDGHTLAAGGEDGTVRLWNTATGKTTTAITGHTGFVEVVAFSPDGHTLATGGEDGTVRLLDVATGKTTTAITGHTGSVAAMAFSPDGHTLTTSGRDGTVRLWNTATGKTTTAITGHTGYVEAVAFSPDGHTLATGGRDGTVRLSSYITPGAAITAICRAVARDLASQERERYLPGRTDETVCPASDR